MLGQAVFEDQRRVEIELPADDQLAAT